MSGGRSTPTTCRRPFVVVLLLLLLLLSATSLGGVAAPLGWGEEERRDQAVETRREALSESALSELVERFADSVVAAAAAGGAGASGSGGGNGTRSSSSSSSPPPLDPETDELLQRLLEVLDPEQQAQTRARLVDAMAVVRPPSKDRSGVGQRRQRRRSLLQNATPLSPLITPSSSLTRDRGGRFGGWAQSFQIIFGSFFDYFLRGGLGFLAPIIGDVLAPLRRYNWVRDVGNAADAVPSNVINANWIPLPQTTADLDALLLRLVAPFCAPEGASSGYQVLGAFRAASLEVELVPWSCEVAPVALAGEEDQERAGREAGLLSKNFRALPPPLQRIDWGSCTPSKLVARLRPSTLSPPYFSSASYTAAFCAFAQPFGVATSVTLGADAFSLQIKQSRTGLDLVPSVVQFEAAGRFFPWLAANIVNNGRDVPEREVAFTSASNSSTGGAKGARRI
jgi:hypothetical protein